MMSDIRDLVKSITVFPMLWTIVQTLKIML